MLRRIKILFTVLATIGIFQLSFAPVAQAQSAIPRGGNISVEKLKWVDEVLEVVTMIFIDKGGYVIGTVSLFAAFIMIKTLPVSVPLFIVALLMIFFPKISPL